MSGNIAGRGERSWVAAISRKRTMNPNSRTAAATRRKRRKIIRIHAAEVRAAREKSSCSL